MFILSSAFTESVRSLKDPSSEKLEFEEGILERMLSLPVITIESKWYVTNSPLIYIKPHRHLPSPDFTP